MILAGDIGGTSTRLGLFEWVGGQLRIVAEHTRPSRNYPALEHIVAEFITGLRIDIQRACFGIAGPVLNGVVRTPNLPWLVDSRNLASVLALDRVTLLNDLEANAYGIDRLAPDQTVTLNAGDSDAVGNIAVISAGTGLGEAGLFWDGREHHPFACEGGHADFAPGNELEMELLIYLRGIFGHVSWERVLSGPGLHNIYNFLQATRPSHESSPITDDLRCADPAMVISQAALAGRCARCADALEIFVSLYGAAAGNLALKMMACGGLYLGGGIAPKIIKQLVGPGFLRAFVAKGRMQPLMESIPVRVLMNDRVALWGAAQFATRSASKAMSYPV